MASSSLQFAPTDASGHQMRVTKDPGIIKVSNETVATSSRITRGGRRITYKARIIQQPNRARACGSGAKSCADRRPVDPPPIIELRIFEGPQDNESEITYEYNANFFVFATLEHARHMATGRLPSSAQNNVPVLTGSPVAGMALLERPTKAGYFIFPDLSVRHEGKYRLNFSLYEELKNVKDMDSEVPDHPDAMKSAHVSHRLEVKTVPFTVFSAKKFPGLTLSTPLSITFAEQGCRVRIRRDVRMRRRNDKGGALDMDTDQYYEHRRVSATPDAYHPVPSVSNSRPPSVDHSERPRSSSVHSNANAHMRRLSADQTQMPYQQDPYATSPQTAQGMYPPHPAWSQPGVDAHNYAQPPPQHHQPYPPHSQYPVPAPPTQSMAPPPYAYTPHHAQQYPAEQPHSRQTSLDYTAASHAHGSPRSATSPQIQQQQQQNSPYPTQNGTAFTVPKAFPHPAPQPPVNAPMPPGSGYHSSRVDSVHSASLIAPQDPYSRPLPQANGVKRDYGSSFDTQALEQPLRHGARPLSNGLDPKFGFGIEASSGNGSDEESPVDVSAMSYRRADGSYSRRCVPLPE